ncbi:hypothetical protein LZ30DRAFT_611106 [Colletotrichum cereale]|nr:hypothetical protein LZ30DRAFT_611106 [Colletotrichum cereale]
MIPFITALVTSLSASVILSKMVITNAIVTSGVNPKDLSLMDDQDGTISYSKRVRIFGNESWIDPAAQRFDQLDKDAIRDSWVRLFPVGWQDAAKQTVSPRKADDSKTQLALFHQLDCLLSILEAFTNFNRTETVEPVPYTFECFSYLHSALLCCSDTALEGSDIYAEADGRNGTLGIGSTHVCKVFN